MICMALAIELTQSCKRYQKYIFIMTDETFVNNHKVMVGYFIFCGVLSSHLMCSFCGDMAIGGGSGAASANFSGLMTREAL